MNISIGIVQSMKEIELELPASTERSAVQTLVNEALTGQGVLWLTDAKGRELGVPGSRISFVEFVEPTSRQVGFGA